MLNVIMLNVIVLSVVTLPLITTITICNIQHKDKQPKHLGEVVRSQAWIRPWNTHPVGPESITGQFATDRYRHYSQSLVKHGRSLSVWSLGLTHK
jgi:hypothetical protein